MGARLDPDRGLGGLAADYAADSLDLVPVVLQELDGRLVACAPGQEQGCAADGLVDDAPDYAGVVGAQQEAVHAHHHRMGREAADDRYGPALQVVDPEHVDAVVGDAVGVAADEDAAVVHHLLAVDVDRRLAPGGSGPGRPAVGVGGRGEPGQLVDQLRDVGVQRLDLAGPRREIVGAAQAGAHGGRAVVGVGARHRDVARLRAYAVGDGGAYLRGQRQVEPDQIAVDYHDLVVVVGQHERGRVQRHVDAGRGLDAPHYPLHPEADGGRDVDPGNPGGQRVLTHVGSPRWAVFPAWPPASGLSGPCTRRRWG